MKALVSEQELAAVALALGAEKVPGLSVAEASLIRNLPDAPRAVVRDVERGTVARRDPLGEILCKVRSPAIRRSRGATYTPAKVIRAMLGWAGSVATPDRVVDEHRPRYLPA